MRSSFPTARFPDFYVVGHPKSGSTALNKMLRQHPQIFMPDCKEPAYFCTDIIERSLTEGEYLALFEGAEPDQLQGEASIWQLASEVAARQITDVRPDAKIILLLREPVAFLRSLHLQNFQNRAEIETDFGRALALEPQRAADPSFANGHEAVLAQLPKLRYSEHIRYVTQVERYREALTTANVHVIIYEEFERDNASAVRAIHRFLGLPEHETAEVRVNASAPMRGARTYRFLNDVRVGRGPVPRVMHRAIKLVTGRRARNRMVTRSREMLLGDAPPPDRRLELELRRRFLPEVQKLGEYLERDLVTAWGYDEVLASAL
jgi:hypothetical protein